MRKRIEAAPAPAESAPAGEDVRNPGFVEPEPETPKPASKRKRVADEPAPPAEPAAAKDDDAPLDPEAWGASLPEIKPMSDDFERITSMTFVENPLEVFQEIEAKLLLGDKRTDYGSVQKALDEVEFLARKAFKLYATAVIEKKRWEMENAEAMAGFRHAAYARLQEEKKKGERNKAITDADVEATIASAFGDEYTAQEIKKKRAELMVKSCENLVNICESRCRNLATQANKLR